MRVGPKIAMARQAFDILVGQLRAGGRRSRALHVRLVAPRAPCVHEQLPRPRRRARRSAPVRQHLALRRHRRHRAASVGTAREPQGDRHPDRRHRHQQRNELGGSLRRRQLDRRAGLRRRDRAGDRSGADPRSGDALDRERRRRPARPRGVDRRSTRLCPQRRRQRDRSRRTCSTNCASATCSRSRLPETGSGEGSKSASGSLRRSSRRAAAILGDSSFGVRDSALGDSGSGARDSGIRVLSQR